MYLLLGTLGLPWASWLLIVVSVGVGLGIEIAFLRTQALRRRTGARPPASGAATDDVGPGGGGSDGIGSGREEGEAVEPREEGP